MKIKSFGCSFIFGSELPDIADRRDLRPSELTWPALIASQQGWHYQCCAYPGRGNLYIVDRIFEQSAQDQCHDVLYIINWTWVDRFDFFSNDRDQWHSILPNDQGKVPSLYHRHLHSQKRDKLVSLLYIQSALQILQQRKIPFVMTSMDPIIRETKWHSDEATMHLQQIVLPFINDFQGRNFLDWSRANNYPVSQLWHPLQQAHAAASELMTPVVLSRITV